MKILIAILVSALVLTAKSGDVPVKPVDFKIPSSWKLISVTKEKDLDPGTGYLLWFQDASGNVFVVSTFKYLGANLKTSDVFKFQSTTNDAPILIK